MQDRYREFITKSGLKIVLLDWINAREFQQINRAMFSQMKLKPMANGTVETGTITADLAQDLDNEAIKVIVKSIDGKSENVLDLILDLPVYEYNEIIAEVKEVQNGKKKSIELN